MAHTITLIDVYHGLNRFLGTVDGELAKDVFELVLFTVVTYMVASEWTRAKDDHKSRLQWLTSGFGVLALTKFLTTGALSFIVLGGLDSPIFFARVSIVDQTFEVLALLMIGIGFIQPVLARRHPFLVPRLKNLVISFFLIGIGLFFWLSNRVAQEPIIVGLYRPAYAWFNLAKLGVVVLIILYILRHYRDFLQVSRYYWNVIPAFVLVAVSPAMHLINFGWYHNQSGELIVAAHPFPFLSVLFFTRVIFLQLADKAALYDEIARTQEKYLKEKEISDMKDEFVSVVSHELKTPLTAISLWGALIGNGKLGKVTPKQKEACSIIKTESFRLAHLINDVLDLSKLEKGKMIISLRAVEIRGLCNLANYEAMAAEKGVRLVNNVPVGLMAEVDPDRFTQVVVNLVSNALKFTEKGGSITIGASQDGFETTVFVADTGIGIPPDKLEEVFSKFYQVDNHLTRRAGGTGLGLAITKQIVELHAGTISVESKVGKGTTFTIRLPRH